MKFVTREPIDQSSDNVLPWYCAEYTLFTKQEIEDWMNVKGFKNKYSDTDSLEYYTDIQCKTDEKCTLYFRFSRKNLEDWYLCYIDTTGWTHTSRPFFKKMALDLDGIYNLYKKKYQKIAATYEKSIKEKLQERRLNDINTDEIEGDFIVLAEKYGFEFESKYSDNKNVKNKTYIFNNPKTNRSISFYGFCVKSKNLHCWQVYQSTPYMKDWYNTYVGSFDAIKQVAEGYMMTYKTDVITCNYDNFLSK